MLWKPGMLIFPRIKFHVNRPTRFARPRRRVLFCVLAVCLLTTLACGQTPAFLLTPSSGQGGGNPINDTQPTGTLQIIGGPGLTPKPENTPDTQTPEPVRTPRPPILYYALSGDTLPAVAARFGVSPQEITSPDELTPSSLIPPNQLLIIPDILDQVGSSEPLLPDSEIVYSLSTMGFDVGDFVEESGGYLSTYREFLETGFFSGTEIIERVAMENSFNPRVLLALLEYQSGWVYGQPGSMVDAEYPIGYVNWDRRDLYKQMTWAARQLTLGYYGWRAGSLVQLTFKDGSTQRIAPGLNAGTVALQYFFAQLYDAPRWPGTLYGAGSLVALHAEMFGDAWLRAQEVEPLFPAFTQQPELVLPFPAGDTWSLTGGPHPAWGSESVFGALDFASPASTAGCYQSFDWVTSPAAGLVARTGPGIVMLDLDGDGHEQTGWVLLLLHIATWEKVQVGTFVDKDDKIGHPSCEGGRATGNHVHIVRKFNGEWIPVDGPLPFVLSGYTAHSGDAAYEGSMTRDDVIVEASVVGGYRSLITRPPSP